MEALLEEANEVELEEVFSELAQRRADAESFSPSDEALIAALKNTELRFGRAPSLAELRSATLNGAPVSTLIDRERWLLDWELQHFGDAALRAPADLSYQNWYEPSDRTDVLLTPWANGWESLAYISWFAEDDLDSPAPLIALLRSWHDRFGAELVAHFGTMLQFVVSRRPRDIEEAWQLAVEQDLVAQENTALPGISLRDHARTLLHADKWFLHKRP